MPDWTLGSKCTLSSSLGNPALYLEKTLNLWISLCMWNNIGPPFCSPVSCQCKGGKQPSRDLLPGDGWWTGRHALHPLSLVPPRAQGLACGTLCPTWFFFRESVSALMHQRRVLCLQWFLSPSGPLSTTCSLPPVLHLKPKEQMCILPACALCSPHLPAISQFSGCSSVLLITGARSPLWLGLVGVLQSLDLSALTNPAIFPLFLSAPSWPESPHGQIAVPFFPASLQQPLCSILDP